MPEAVFLLACNSLLQMSWPCSKTLGACFMILSLQFTIKSTLIFFPHHWCLQYHRVCWIILIQILAIFIAVWTFCKALSSYRPSSKPVAFHNTHIWAGAVFVSIEYVASRTEAFQNLCFFYDRKCKMKQFCLLLWEGCHSTSDQWSPKKLLKWRGLNLQLISTIIALQVQLILHIFRGACSSI